MRTQVGIVGAGPAGLMLSHLLHLAGISSIIIENRSRAYCEARVRAGLMENWVAQMLIDTGVGERLKREAMVHDGIYISFKGEARHIDFHKLIGKQVYIYDQKEVVTDLIAQAPRRRRRRSCSRSRTPAFTISPATSRRSASATRARRRRSSAISSAAATASTASAGRAFRPACCAATTGSIRSAGSASSSESPPPEKELIYCFHERGFALFSMRGPELSRLYLQCAPDEDIEQWSDAAHLGRAGDAARRRAPAQARQDSAEGHHADAQLRHRADAVGPAVSRRRRRPHRAADRRQGHEPRDGRRARARRARSRRMSSPAARTC